MIREKFLAVALSTYIIIQLATRAVIFATSHDLIDAAAIIQTLALGSLYDIVAGMIFVVPLMILTLSTRISRRIIMGSLFVLDFVTVFIAVAQFLFWREFHTNFNFIAVDYLIYTTEMIGNAWQSFNVPLLMILIVLITVAIFNVQQRLIGTARFRRLKVKAIALRLVALVLIPTLSVLIVRSDWRESISDNRHNVELAGNGAYEFIRAFFANELDYQTFYLTEDDAAVIQRLRSMIAADNATFKDEQGIERRVENHNQLTDVKPNVIIITVESLNADFTGYFGGSISKHLTPRLDEIAARSFCFTNMLATGTRTVRGLEALSLSLPPTPGQSILRRPDNAGLASLGEVFRSNGYACDFIYGGYGYFDNMNAFFGANGYVVKDRTSIPDDEIFHETIWGVADEILFSQVIKSMDEHFANNERAFEMVMTTSNHRPFEFPADRIDMPSGTRPAAVMYTDWAIADFIDRAESKPWFDETIFVIVADHQALAAGKTTLPVNCYHIPCMIYAPKLIEPARFDRLISQMDLPPTLLGMIGISYDSKFLGRDVMRGGNDAAFISTYQMLGYVKGDRLIVLTPDKRATTYHIDDWLTSEYTLLEPDQPLIDEAVAYYQGASHLYRNGLLKRSSAARQ